MYEVGQVLETRDSIYHVISRADEADCNGEMNLFVKIIRTSAPHKGQVKFACVTDRWLLNWVNTHLKFPLKDQMEYYSNNGTPLFEGERYTIEGQKGVFICTKREGISLIREGGGLRFPFIDIVEKNFFVVSY